MARVVAEVAPAYENLLEWETVITKDLNGARRYAELSQKKGRPLPVPSIIIDGELVFDAIPGVEDLKKCLDSYIKDERK
jgi:predicted thioredoxin/glutaredoxin